MSLKGLSHGKGKEKDAKMCEVINQNTNCHESKGNISEISEHGRQKAHRNITLLECFDVITNYFIIFALVFRNNHNSLDLKCQSGIKYRN